MRAIRFVVAATLLAVGTAACHDSSPDGCRTGVEGRYLFNDRGIGGADYPGKPTAEPHYSPTSTELVIVRTHSRTSRVVDVPGDGRFRVCLPPGRYRWGSSEALLGPYFTVPRDRFVRIVLRASITLS